MTLTQRADRAASETLLCQRRHKTSSAKAHDAVKLRGLEMLRALQRAGHSYTRAQIAALMVRG
jgi:hypothetical protein